MTAEDAPTTLLVAITRELQAAAYDGALGVAIRTGEPRSPERIAAITVADTFIDRDMTDEAISFLNYLNKNFGTALDGATARLPEPPFPR